MKLDIFVLVWGIIPAIIAIMTIIRSLRMAWGIRNGIHIFLGAVIFTGNTWSLIILYRIFFSPAWPTFLPHVVIATEVGILAIQHVMMNLGR